MEIILLSFIAVFGQALPPSKAAVFGKRMLDILPQIRYNKSSTMIVTEGGTIHMPTMTVIVLGVLGMLCLVGAVLVMRYAFTYDKPRKQPAAPEPLPGGGGWYTMRVAFSGKDGEQEALEAALNAVPNIRAQADAASGEVRIRYEGYPALDLLDRLRNAAEEAGFTVTEIE